MNDRLFILSALALTLSLAQSAKGDDTEIFLSEYGATGASSGRPKVLILFDNSGSMGNGIPQAKQDFDPDFDWTTHEHAPGSFGYDKIYWSTDGNPPSESTDRYVLAASNRCNTSIDPLYQTGRYTDYLRAWRNDYRAIGTETVTECTWEQDCTSEWICTLSFYGYCLLGYWDQDCEWEEVCQDRERDVYGNVDVWDIVADNNDTRTSAHVECAADIDDNDPTNPGIDDGWPSDAGGPFVSASGAPGDPWDSTQQRHDGNLTRTLFTGNYLSWYYNDHLTDNRTKIEIARDVITDLIENNPQVDFGLMVFNMNNGNANNDENGGRVVRHLRYMNEADRSSMISLIDGLTDETWTPLCETYYEAYRYLAKPNGSPQAVFYGDDDSSHTPYRDPCAESEDDNGTCAYDGTYNSPLGDCEQIYLVLMTDGRPTHDQHANSRIRSLLQLDECDDYMTDHGNSLQENCLPDLARHMYQTDLDDYWQNGDQRVVTYTIGFLTDQVLLSDTAENGGGTYYTALDAHTLADAFQATLTEILSSNTTFAAPAVAVDTFNRTRSLNDIYIAMFRPEIRPRWGGNVKKLTIDDQTGVVSDADGVRAIDPITGRIKDTATTFWTTQGVDGMEVDEGGAGEVLTLRDLSTRVLKTNTGANDALQDFATTNANLTTAMFGAATTDSRNLMINWSRGVDVRDEDDDDSVSDNRPWIMGDIMHSRPLAINYGNTQDPTDPEVRILFGTNAGFLHMIDADDGSEAWAFFPKETAGVVKTLLANDANDDHPYAVDGSPAALLSDANDDGSLAQADGDKAHIYFGLRRGGTEYYALDIINPDNPSMLWQTGRDDLRELGQTWSTPAPTKVPGYSNPVVIIGAGYDTNKDSTGLGAWDLRGRGLFILDAYDGSLVFSITPYTTSTTNLQEIELRDCVPASVKPLDSNGDDITDRIYFGDTGGNVWRVDLPGTNTDDWSIFKLANLGSDSTQADDRRFFSEIDIAQTRWGDLTYDAVLIGSGNRAHPLERDVQERFYMIRDFETETMLHIPNDDDDQTDLCANTYYNPRRLPCAEAPLVITDANLFNATDNAIQDGTADEQLSATQALESSTTKGWYINLENSGEKSLSRSITLQGRVFFTTYVPPDPLDPNVEHLCRPSEGKGFLYAVNLHDARAMYDWAAPEGTQLSKPDRKKQIKDNIPDYPVAHFGDPWIRLVGVGPGTDGQGSEDTGLMLSTQPIYWMEEVEN